MKTQSQSNPILSLVVLTVLSLASVRKLQAVDGASSGGGGNIVKYLGTWMLLDRAEGNDLEAFDFKHPAFVEITLPALVKLEQELFSYNVNDDQELVGIEGLGSLLIKIQHEKHWNYKITDIEDSDCVNGTTLRITDRRIAACQSETSVLISKSVMQDPTITNKDKGGLILHELLLGLVMYYYQSYPELTDKADQNYFQLLQKGVRAVNYWLLDKSEQLSPAVLSVLFRTHLRMQFLTVPRLKEILEGIELGLETFKGKEVGKVDTMLLLQMNKLLGLENNTNTLDLPVGWIASQIPGNWSVIRFDTGAGIRFWTPTDNEYENNMHKAQLQYWQSIFIKQGISTSK